MGVRAIVILFILFMSVNSSAQSRRDSSRVLVSILNEVGDGVKGVDIIIIREKSIIGYGLTDEKGVIEFDFRIIRNKIIWDQINFIENGKIRIAGRISLDGSYDYYQEFILNAKNCYDPVDYDILFKAGTDTLRDEKDLFLLKELMERFPNMEVDLKACYKFNETESVAYQRIRKVKAKVRELGIDSLRLNYSVMDRDYVSYDIERDCDTIFYNGVYLYNANAYHVSRYNDKYQAVEVEFNFKTVRNEEEWE